MMKTVKSPTCWFASVILATAIPVPTAGQQGQEPLYDGLLASFKKDYLSLGLLLQTVADFQFDRTLAGHNGFSVANFRLLLSGELDAGFGYFVATNFVDRPAILDAMMYYRASPAVSIGVGQFKVPFSREFLTYAGNIDLVNRSQAVTVLAPGRQIGAQLAIDDLVEILGLTLGAFNGNATSVNGNDNDSFLYALRLCGIVAPQRDDEQATQIEFGINLAHSKDDGVSLGDGLVTAFTGKRTLAGGDVRAEIKNLLLAGEVIHASLSPEIGAARHPWGFHATAGVQLSPKVQGLIRWDGFDPDNLDGRSDWIVLGLNVWPTAVTEMQLNYVVDTDAAAVDHHQLLVNFQLGF